MNQQSKTSSSQSTITRKQHKQEEEPHIVYLNESHVEEAAQMLTNSFIKLNPMWVKMGAKFNEVLSVIRGRIIYCARKQCSTVLIEPKTGRLIVVNYNIDLVDYVKVQSMPNNSQFFKTLKKYADELQNEYFGQLMKTTKKGQIIYSYGGASDPSIKSKGHIKKIWAFSIALQRLAGYKFLIGRSTNRITTRLLLDIGGKVLKRVQITEPNIQNQFLELILIDLNNLSFDSLSKYYPERKSQEEQEEEFN